MRPMKPDLKDVILSLKHIQIYSVQIELFHNCKRILLSELLYHEHIKNPLNEQVADHTFGYIHIVGN